MIRPLRIARVTVTHWPTDDGRPWHAWVEAGTQAAVWIERLPAELAAEFAIEQRSDFASWVEGWKLPRPDRRHYLSPSAARRWAAAARRLGAVVDVELSDPVVWSAGPEPAPEKPAQTAHRVETVELPAPSPSQPPAFGCSHEEPCQCWLAPF